MSVHAAEGILCWATNGRALRGKKGESLTTARESGGREKVERVGEERKKERRGRRGKRKRKKRGERKNRDPLHCVSVNVQTCTVGMVTKSERFSSFIMCQEIHLCVLVIVPVLVALLL